MRKTVTVLICWNDTKSQGSQLKTMSVPFWYYRRKAALKAVDDFMTQFKDDRIITFVKVF